MSYASIAFAYFVLALLILYYVLPQRFRYLALLLASYVFYVMACGKYVIYILVTTAATYAGGIGIQGYADSLKRFLADNPGLSRDEKKTVRERSKGKRRRIMICTLLLNFGVLAVLKYADFTVANVNLLRLHLFGNTDFFRIPSFVLPLGISFYTFQSMGYIIDLYFGKYEAQKDPLKLALYVSFFPQIIQGPISRYNELSGTLFEGHAFAYENICRGFYRILWGLFKKLIVADRLAPFVERTADRYASVNGTYLLLMIFFYSMEIYGDFSGGIDISIGVARLFGIDVTENFERPFFSKSVAEYWRRWHITLGTWFKDYIFYPITVSKNVLNLSKKVREKGHEELGKRIPIYLAMFIVWFTTGLWHGAQWRYVIWGLLNFVILVFSTEAEPLYARINTFLKWDGSILQKCFRVLRTFWIMSFLRVFDVSSQGVSQALVIIKKVVLDPGAVTLAGIEELGLDPQELYAALAGILIMFIFSMIQRKGSITDRILAMPALPRWAVTALTVMAVVIFGSYGMGYDARAFIYLQF